MAKHKEEPTLEEIIAYVQRYEQRQKRGRGLASCGNDRSVISEKRWDNLNIAFENFRLYVTQGKRDPDVLTLIDLLHVSNFKGGYASIIDREAQVNERLVGLH